jgi:hypothetical protein
MIAPSQLLLALLLPLFPLFQAKVLLGIVDIESPAIESITYEATESGKYGTSVSGAGEGKFPEEQRVNSQGNNIHFYRLAPIPNTK